MSIQPKEIQLIGKWSVHNGQMIADPICDRINKLIESDLKKVSHDARGWDSLYFDPNDDRLWELIYPLGEMQGGGPPKLSTVSPGEAQRKYSWSVALKLPT